MDEQKTKTKKEKSMTEKNLKKEKKMRFTKLVQIRKWSKVQPEFEELTEGHKFQILGFKTLPKGKSVSCARCGYKLRHYLELKRDDGQILKISKGCFSKADLKIVPCSTLSRS